MNVNEDLIDRERVHYPTAVHEVVLTLAGTTCVAKCCEHCPSNVALWWLPGHKLRMASRMSDFWKLLVDLPSRILIGMVRLYQIFLSPLIGQQCRFHPTCSRYFIQAVQKHGAIKGSLKGAWRICRCHPFNPGGYDPP